MYNFAIGVSPLDCMGCGVCVEACLPRTRPSRWCPRRPRPSRPRSGITWWKTAPKADMQDNTVKGSQFKQPYLQFSGSCAGCAETSYPVW